MVMELVRVKAWTFARPVISNYKMAFTDCGAAYLRNNNIHSCYHKLTFILDFFAPKKNYHFFLTKRHFSG
jgi:hypothetical protein